MSLKVATLAEVSRALPIFLSVMNSAALPTAVRNPVVVLEEENRPQPRRDVNAGNGMAAVVGRVRECPLLDVSSPCSSQPAPGAAGAALLNAELLAARGFFSRTRVPAEVAQPQPVAR